MQMNSSIMDTVDVCHLLNDPHELRVKLDFKELLIKEQIDFKELFTDYQLFYTINLLLNKELLLI